MKRRRDKEVQIAKERIYILFDLANKIYRKDKNLSHRYVELARKIGMKYNVSIPKELKRSFCKKCGHLLVPGLNARVRIRSEGETRMVITCLDCDENKRYPLNREKHKG